LFGTFSNTKHEPDLPVKLKNTRVKKADQLHSFNTGFEVSRTKKRVLSEAMCNIHFRLFSEYQSYNRLYLNLVRPIPDFVL
jgi:hypothetical protein